MTRLDGRALNGRVRPVADRRCRNLISIAEFCENRAGHAVGSSSQLVARDRHIDSRYFAGDASKGFEYAVVCVRLRPPVSGVVVIRVRDFHSHTELRKTWAVVDADERCECRWMSGLS